jgi:hypothetical protein
MSVLTNWNRRSDPGEYRMMRTRIAAVLVLLFLGGSRAWAVLGESVRTVQDDQQYMRGNLVVMTHRGYSIHQISSSNGHVIKEYVSLQGSVFGISWQGSTIPNLQQFLGSYFTQLQDAMRSSRRRRGPLVVRTDQVVIETGGHQRSFHGRAYIPDLLPATVSPADIQ